jgi:hypothetical protein
MTRPTRGHRTRIATASWMRCGVAGGDGRPGAEELDTRLESALSARTRGELAERRYWQTVNVSEGSRPSYRALASFFAPR